MPKVKESWRFRKRSEADPVEVLPCGCHAWVYDGTVVRYCERHLAQQRAAGGPLKKNELKED